MPGAGTRSRRPEQLREGLVAPCGGTYDRVLVRAGLSGGRAVESGEGHVMTDQHFDAETAGFERYTIADPAGSPGEPAATLYETAVDPAGATSGPGPGETGDEYIRRMGAQRMAENAASFRDYGPVGRSPNEPISDWDMPSDFTDADRDAFQRAIGKTDSEPTTWEEAAAYNRAAGQNLGAMTDAGMDSVEAFESQAQMYTQIDDV